METRFWLVIGAMALFGWFGANALADAVGEPLAVAAIVVLAAAGMTWALGWPFAAAGAP